MTGVMDGTRISRRSIRERYRPSREAESRLLLLVDWFSRMRSGAPRCLEGRTKLAKLDFLLRYPRHLWAVLLDQGVPAQKLAEIDPNEAPLDARMMRYRFGPWDPSHFANLGALVGRGLLESVPYAGTTRRGFRTTDLGAGLAGSLRSDDSFSRVQGRIVLLRRHLDISGTALKTRIYQIAEVDGAAWNEELR